MVPFVIIDAPSLLGLRPTGVEELQEPIKQRLHLDADVLNDEIMPAVDYRLADGLQWESVPAGKGPNVSLDQVPESRTGKRDRLHLDLYANNQERESGETYYDRSGSLSGEVSTG